jgi:hypothetical protein
LAKRGFSALLVAACPARVAAKLLLAVPPYGWGVTFGGETVFSFVGKGGVFTLRWFLPARQGLQPGRWRQAVSWRLCRLETTRALWVLCRLTDGAGKTVFSFVGKWCVLSCSCFLLAQQGPKPLFLLRAKEKAVLDSEKEKVDQWKSWGGALQQDRLPMLRCCSSGKILWAILLSSAACV